MHTAIKYFSKSLAMIMIIFAAGPTKAQSDTVRLLDALIKLEGAHINTEFLRFVTEYYYREVEDVTEVKDTMEFAYQVSFNKFRISTDDNSVLMIQNDLYRMSFYVEDSMVLVDLPTRIFRRLFDMDFYDEQMRERAIGNIDIIDSSHYKRLSITGLAGSPLHSYNLTYDTTNFHITRITYDLRKQVYNPSAPYANPDLISVKIIFKDYTMGSYDDTHFDTFEWFVRQGGGYKPGILCTNCEIIDMTN